ncbi:MAG: hypothetical protein P8X96_23380 [Desulfobacteraceae bacterium]
MAIDISIEGGKGANHQMSLDDDGYYWYLHPLFVELRDRTGIYIDLYGDATFNRGNIAQFELLINKANDLLKKEPDKWKVKTGVQTHPVKKAIFQEVTKKTFENKLKTLSAMVKVVKNSTAKLVFFGD